MEFLGTWNVVYTTRSSATYKITEDEGSIKVAVVSCDFDECNNYRTASPLVQSENHEYSSDHGYFQAEPVHKSHVTLYVKRKGDKMNVVYFNAESHTTTDGEGSLGKSDVV